MQRFMQGFALLCFVSVALQYNDPDPLAWMLIYAAAGGAAALPLGGRWSRVASSLVLSVALTWALFLLPEGAGIGIAEMTESMEAHGGRVEIAREAWGLLLIVTGLSVGLALDARVRANESSD